MRENEIMLLDHTGEIVAMGSERIVFSMLKHHKPDGRYQIVGHDYKVHCIRKDGVVGPDPDDVFTERVEIISD